MRLVLILLLALAVTILLTLMPEVASQMVRIQAFGWEFEARQGAFIVALLVILGGVWLIRALISALLAGPGQVWQGLRAGSRKRREALLRDGLSAWLDMRDDHGAKAMRKATGVIPDWALGMLRILATPARDQELPGQHADPLQVALAARIATDPAAQPAPDLPTRKAHLEAWLAAHPGAPLALQRLADMSEEEGDWATASQMLEEQWKRGFRSASAIKPRLAHAYVALAATDPDQEMHHLRKALRLLPDDPQVVLAMGRAMLRAGDHAAAQKLWLQHVESHDDMAVARELLSLFSKDAMKQYRRMENREAAGMNAAHQWLRAQLAQAANLSGMAREHLNTLLNLHPGPMAWQSLGDWHAAQGDWQEAARCYQHALDNEPKAG
jgi:tetratricopeptide (TPR) repeat protein